MLPGTQGPYPPRALENVTDIAPPVAVVSLHQPHHLEAAGEHLRHLQGHLGRLSAGAEKQHFLELLRQQAGQGLAKLDHLFAD